MSLLSTYKIPQPKGYSRKSFYVEDTSETSPNYFAVEFFPTVMGGGRHVIKLKGNGFNLRLDSKIDVEIIDAEGRPVYCEVVDYYDRFYNYYISVDIYDITAAGVATAYFVGESVLDNNGNPIPQEYRDTYNTVWIKEFNILPTERNNADLIFDTPPQVGVAQIVTPAQSPTSSLTTQFAVVTSSANQLTIQSSNFEGYDRDFASSTDIVDPRIRAIKINPTNQPTTENTVPTAIRERSREIIGGYLLGATNRFGTIISSSTPFFTKDMLGGQFKFFSLDTTPSILQPDLPSNLTLVSSSQDQLETFKSTIVDVIDSRKALIDKSLEVSVFDSKNISRGGQTKYKYRSAAQFTGSVTYAPTIDTYVTSSVVNSSYVEFTFTDMNPISGQVYRIKTSTKLGSITGEYKLLNDQIIKPVEYLTDAQFPNSLNYARHESDYRLLGHFYTQSIIDYYWSGYLETPTSFDLMGVSRDTSIQSDSANIVATFTQSFCLTTQFNQNYNTNQTYTITYNLTLDPYSELEVYMSSDDLNTFITSVTPYPKAFNKGINNEQTRYGDQYSRFGKFVGVVTNNSPNRKSYGTIVMDFQTDNSGLGKPIFRLRPTFYMTSTTAKAWISEMGIKPYLINGFTPNIVQYAVPLSSELISATQLSQSIDFKIEYFDYTGKQSEYITYIDDVVLNLKQTISSNVCQDQTCYFYYDSNIGINNPQTRPTY